MAPKKATQGERPGSYDKWTAPQLKAELARCGWSSSGTKPFLVQRLRELRPEGEVEEPEAAPEAPQQASSKKPRLSPPPERAVAASASSNAPSGPVGEELKEADLRDQLRHAQAELVREREAAGAWSSQRVGLERKLADAAERGDHASAEAEAARAQVEALRAEVVALKAELAEAATQQKALAASLGKSREGERAAREELATSQKAAEELRKALAQTEEQNLALKAREAELSAKLASLPGKTVHSFATSHFKRLYDEAAAPEDLGDFLGALKQFLGSACPKVCKPTPAQAEIRAFYEELYHEAISGQLSGGEKLSQVQALATRAWASGECIKGKEFCALLNDVIRRDDAQSLAHAVVLTRAINELCVNRAKEGASKVWPGNNRTYRGGGLPKEHQGFFELGKKYRVPMFLATSFNKETVALSTFARRAEEQGLPPVLYTIHFDKKLRCVHVNYLGSRGLGGEKEFLFAPYSVFKVLKVDWKSSPNWEKPHEVELMAAVDNKHEAENLPLAPWH